MLFSIIASVAISIGELPSLVHSDCEVRIFPRRKTIGIMV